MAAAAPVVPGTGRGGRASGAPPALPGTTTSLALLLFLLLLLPISLQVLQESQGTGGHVSSRLFLMTPFWRMVGSRPLGAHCRHSLDCVTRACRSGRCAPPQYEC